MRKNRENQLPLSPSWPDHRLLKLPGNWNRSPEDPAIKIQISEFYTICVTKSAGRTEPGA